jgi:hypothetical protein
LEQLRCIVERITYANEENGYTSQRQEGRTRGLKFTRGSSVNFSAAFREAKSAESSAPAPRASPI